MASIDICDICGTRENVFKRFFETDRRADAAGQMEDVGEQFDLCESCELRILRLVCGDGLTQAQLRALNRRIVELIREEQKR